MRNSGAGFELGCLYGFIRLALPFTNDIRLHSWPKFCQSYRTTFQTSWSYLGITHTIKLFSRGGGFIHIASDRDVPLFYLIMMCLGHHIDLHLHQLRYLSECPKFCMKMAFHWKSFVQNETFSWKKPIKLSFKRSAFHLLVSKIDIFIKALLNIYQINLNNYCFAVFTVDTIFCKQMKMSKEWIFQ